jgi:hypothetical protein
VRARPVDNVYVADGIALPAYERWQKPVKAIEVRQT